MKNQREIYAGVDIGTAACKVLLGEFLPGDSLSVLAFAEVPTLKMCKAEAVDTRVVAGQVAQALAKVEEEAGFPLPEPFFLALSGAFIETIRVTGRVGIPEDVGLVRQCDIEEAARQTNTVDVPAGKVCLPQVVNRLSRLSDGRVLFNPIGQYSASLEVETQYFLADLARANTTYCLLSENIGKMAIAPLIYTPLAVSSAVFPPGASDDALALVIDIGAGMTSIAMPTSVGHFYLGQVSIGCDHIANDLSIAFDLPFTTASALLTQLAALHCTAVASKDHRARMITIGQDSVSQKRQLPASSVEIVLEARLRELFELIRRQLDDAGAYSWLGNRVLLSGGGARIPHITELAATVFNRKVALAQPYRVTGRSDFQPLPQFNTVLGLLRAGYRDLQISREVEGNASALDSTLEWWKKTWKIVFEW